ncbi:uncharacterized protein LOC116005468 [Ipomoea triloba]|uniref:uncharacterized protein LOC116005468 n=1 Tax=Ipomoea triloba TaxID=35885 RepID=UPI00125E1F3A|nr:uncharacterized protein LOC116005468 [Ipomoea triloba]
MTDYKSPGSFQDKVEGSAEKGIDESVHNLHAMNGQQKHRDSEEGNNKTNKADPEGGENVARAPGEVNMEAEITPDDVMRAGGFGARDDIGSFLPTAVDTTDFEASLRDARGYEEPQERVCRPGLGWTDEAAKK